MIGHELWPVSYPQGEVRPTDFRLVEVEVPRPRAGEVLVRNTWTSVDAALRLRLRESARFLRQSIRQMGGAASA